MRSRIVRAGTQRKAVSEKHFKEVGGGMEGGRKTDRLQESNVEKVKLQWSISIMNANFTEGSTGCALL